MHLYQHVIDSYLYKLKIWITWADKKNVCFVFIAIRNSRNAIFKVRNFQKRKKQEDQNITIISLLMTTIFLKNIEGDVSALK